MTNFGSGVQYPLKETATDFFFYAWSLSIQNSYQPVSFQKLFKVLQNGAFDTIALFLTHLVPIVIVIM